jgi:hypothetical protein
MDPFVVYLLLIAGALLLFAVATATARKPARACLSCGRQTPIEGRSCRHCGYRPGRV